MSNTSAAVTEDDLENEMICPVARRVGEFR